MAKITRINVYIIDQAYGGPAEGGWYYETGEPFMSLRVDMAPDISDVNDVAQALRTMYPDRGYRYSVTPKGQDYLVLVEDHPISSAWPQHRPHYE